MCVVFYVCVRGVGVFLFVLLGICVRCILLDAYCCLCFAGMGAFCFYAYVVGGRHMFLCVCSCLYVLLGLCVFLYLYVYIVVCVLLYW